MMSTKHDLLAGLAKLNANEYSYQKDPVAYNEYINTLDEQFSVFIEHSSDKEDVYLLWAIFTMMDFHDEDGAIKICNAWWERCKDPLALIFHAYILDQYRGGVDEFLFKEMQKVKSVSDAKVESMRFMYMGIHFINKSVHSQSFVEYLERSISIYQYNVHSNVELGHFYKKEKDITRSNHYFNQAVSGVTYICYDPKEYNIYSGEGYINSMILWSDCNKLSFESLQNNLDKAAD